MNEHYLFLIGLSLISIHEMDAMRCKEWRIFPGLSLLSDKMGEIVFIFAHIPIFFFVFFQLIIDTNNRNFIVGFDIFLIVHVGLHLILLNHKNNLFKDWISWIIIVGAGIFGLLDILLS